MTQSLTNKARAGRLAALAYLNTRNDGVVSIFTDRHARKTHRTALQFVSRRQAMPIKDLAA